MLYLIQTNHLNFVWAMILSVIFVTLVNAFVVTFVGYPFFKAFQQRGYNFRGFKNYLNRHSYRYLARLAVVCMFSVLAYLVFSVLFTPFINEVFAFLALAFYLVFTYLFFRTTKFTTDRQKVSFTPRMKRLYATVFVIMLIVTLGLILLVIGAAAITISPIYKYVLYLPICITPLLVPVVIILANYINMVFEVPIKAYYIKKAKKRLAENPNLIKIGVTGSFGKTSVKNILTQMLKSKYNTLTTPYSYNTPMGVVKTINEQLTKDTQVFVVEMGARKLGDIKEITDIVGIDIAVLTALAIVHLESFKSLDNIAKGKYEIIEALPEKGLAFINGDSIRAVELYDKTKVEKYLCGLKSEYVYAKDITASAEGLTFTLCYSEQKTTVVTTKLLGKHNLSNILLSAGVAKRMGVDIEDVKMAIEELKPISHRLEIIKGEGNSIIIDDSFNSNTIGSKCALDVLGMFSGNKIVITPGLIELGSLQEYENKKLGENIAKVANYCVVVGGINNKAILTGLKSGGFNQDNILSATSLAEAMEKLKGISTSCDVILFENDLPDILL